MQLFFKRRFYTSLKSPEAKDFSLYFICKTMVIELRLKNKRLNIPDFRKHPVNAKLRHSGAMFWKPSDSTLYKVQLQNVKMRVSNQVIMSQRGGVSLAQLFRLVIKCALRKAHDWLIRDLPWENNFSLSNDRNAECSRLDSLPCVFVCIALFSADIMRTKGKKSTRAQ